jgi:hypothetical protein
VFLLPNCPRSKGRNRIIKYKLEHDCILLKNTGLRESVIAQNLNNSGKVPLNDLVTYQDVNNFFIALPEIQQGIVTVDKATMVRSVSLHFDLIHEISSLFARTKKMLDKMEEKADEQDRLVGAMSYKAISSEMREMLRHMTDVQKDLMEYDNVRRFMEVVIGVLQTECPAQIPKIAAKLRITKGTQWFSSLLVKEDEDECESD